MAGEVSIVAIVKDEERYVFMYDDDSRAETLRMLGRYASDPDLSFTWYDAAVLSQKIRKTQPSLTCEAIVPEACDRHGFPESDTDTPPFPDLDFPNHHDDMWIGDDPVG